MDFSPMHPDTWAETDAERWSFYIQHRQAFEDGRDEVKADYKKAKEKKRKEAEIARKQAEFVKKHS